MTSINLIMKKALKACIKFLKCKHRCCEQASSKKKRTYVVRQQLQIAMICAVWNIHIFMAITTSLSF